MVFPFPNPDFLYLLEQRVPKKPNFNLRRTTPKASSSQTQANQNHIESLLIYPSLDPPLGYLGPKNCIFVLSPKDAAAATGF